MYKRLFKDEGILHNIAAFETKQNLVTLVTSDGYPFALINKPAFRHLIQPRLDTLANNGHVIHVDRHLIGTNIQEASDHIRRYIKSELKAARFFSGLHIVRFRN